MAFEETLRRVSLPAGGPLPIKVWSCVAIDANGNASVPAVGTRISGVAQSNDGTASGIFIEVAINGISKVTVGTAGCTAGDLLMTDGSGNVVTATGSNQIVGQAVTSGVSGDVIPMLMKIL